MAALCHFPSFSCVSHKLCAVRHPLLKVDEQQLLRWETHLLFTRTEITRLTISASSIKKPRVSKKVKSNVDLCNDLREFVSAVGLPEGHVPSTKELSQHGRKDLANIVRRRGYKKIKEFLTNSTEGDTNTEKSSAKNQDVANSCESESTEGHNEEVNKLGDYIFLSSESHVEENHENHLSSTNGVLPFNSGIQSCEAVESPTSLSLHEKAAKFIQYGELDAIEDIGYGISSTCGVDDDKRWTESNNETEVELSPPSEASSKNEVPLYGSSTIAKQALSPETEHHAHRDDFSSAEELNSDDLDEDLDAKATESDDQFEINHLKAMLHQKELELSQLKEQIEKEKLALSILQTKAESVIGKAQKSILEKHAELHAAEESLCGLKEVQIGFWGNGETVEVAGSFNGWHHPIRMDSDLSSNTIRKSRLWSTMLWLYPGTYEIKFIVDGHWRIDPQRELVTRGTIQNNILRVE